MTKVVTERYEQMVLEVDFDDGDPPAYLKICGMKGVNVKRTAQITATEVPDCDDESKPNETERDVRALEVKASASGVWAQTSGGKMLDWFYSGRSIPARLGNLNAAVGDTEFEVGRVVLASLSNERTDSKGKVTADIELEFDGTPARTVKA
ncbi:phage tail tube protein [Thalassovita sp.]|uniref:phage tail tube protein n=1 Tax=Thalassovita sp. TaxID=1979401 RepID=UPI002B26B453|nr:phage tail tube protein [Thalassovita sp.]